MTPEQALEFIHSIERFGSKPGLRRVTMLLERMGNPQKRLKFIHVAGTNGKGSTCTMLSHVLSRAGYRTGLYISPFVLDFRERIQVDNRMIEPEELAACTQVVKEHWEILNDMGEPPTEFEVVVAIAMEYFIRRQCDVVVLEVGMGGRFDATNVIDTPLCSVITSIGIDHVEYLGDTIEQIAMEKCGIIKPGGVTVTYPQQDPAALAVIMEHAAEMNNRLLSGNVAGIEILYYNIEGSCFQYDNMEIHVPLAGVHQIYNSVTVLETLKAIAPAGFGVSPKNIVGGIAETRFPSRLEVLHQKPLVLLDGAHNLSGAQALASTLELLKDRSIHAVMGMVADKDVDGVLAEILPHCKSVAAVAAHVPRAMPARELARLAAAHCDIVTCQDDSRKALKDTLAACGDNDVMLVCGSLYLASELRPMLMELVGMSN